ncbi:hypothetical protein [Nonomuraea sp. NPDC002799]
MISRSKRIFGVAVLSLAAMGTMAAPAHADDDLIGEAVLHELRMPFCMPGDPTGIPVLDLLLPQLMGCGGLISPR